MPEIAIVVLNWNNSPDTVECLQSLERLDRSACRIVLVDNGSTNDSVQVIRRGFPGVIVLETHQNLGYAGGNNVGVRYALAQDADYICILNNDVTVTPNFLAPMLNDLEEHADLGIATPLIADMAEPAKVWALGSAVDWRSGVVRRLHAGEAVELLLHRGSIEVDVASGAAMLVKREVFTRVGLMDEAFYLYYEEIDWCLRARQAGFRILAVPSSLVWHKVSATLGQASPVVDYYMLRNHLRFISQHWSGSTRLALLGRTVLRNLLTIVVYTLRSHGGQRLPHRNARLLALRDAAWGRWGKMGADEVKAACY